MGQDSVSASRWSPAGGALVWAAIVVPIWSTLAWCIARQPTVFDMWTPYMWHRAHAVTLSNLWAFAVENYEYNNPRLGNLLTLLVCTPGIWNALVTPVVELAMFWIATALILGRWPSWRRADDAGLFLTVVAMVVVAAPEVGLMLLYAPYTGNYVFGFALGLAFLIPYRFDVERARARGWARVPAIALLGAAAGLCNAHTGPTFVLIAAAAVAHHVITQRRRPPAWMIAGLVGFAIGLAALLLAPGQQVRYGGLATQQTILERITSRGFIGNVRVFNVVAHGLERLWPWLLLAGAARLRTAPARATRGERIATWASLIAAVTILATVLGSPLLGGRLDFAAVVLACAAFAGIAGRHLQTVGTRAAGAALAAGFLVYAGLRCVPAYRVLDRESRARVAKLEHAPPGATVSLAPFSVPRTRYNVGDDLTKPGHVEELARWFELARVEIATTAP